MTQEDKQLLLKDLSARLPYGVMIQHLELFYPSRMVVEKLVGIDREHINDDGVYIEHVKPYLRPMSSMTEEEKEDYFNVCDEDIETLRMAMDAPDVIMSHRGRTQGYVACKELEWLYEHHFDFIRKVGDEYKTLIDLGLALEAPKEMYKKQNEKVEH